MDFKWKKKHRERLEKATGPMALVIKAQLKSIELKKAGEDARYEAVKELIRECYPAGYSSNDIYTVVKFIEWVIRISKENEKRLKEEIVKIEEDYNMPYLASWERSAKRKGKIEGKFEGIQLKAKEAAKRMIDRGFKLEVVMDISGLSKEEIKKL
jgi:predicted transposase/invertase (TIGR01784 family)